MMTEAPFTCANHPDRATTLRCNRCEKPICSQCAILTPVGYRCKECVRGQQAIFETARPVDYPVAAILSAVGVALGAALLNYLGYWGLLLAPVAGGGLAEVVRWAVRRRRGRRLPLVAAIGGALGVLPLVLCASGLLPLFRALDVGGLGAVAFSILWPIADGAIIIGTLYYRLSGLRL
jgi:hypothetical protein